MICWKCGTDIKLENISRNSECPSCKVDLHCCKACKFFSPGNHYDCKESVDELIADKERSNFCDYFKYNENLSVSKNNKSQEAKDAFNALFG